MPHCLRIFNPSESEGVFLSYVFCLFKKDSEGVAEEASIIRLSVQIPLQLDIFLNIETLGKLL